MKFAKLISRAESFARIAGKLSEKEIKEIFLDANLNTLYDHMAKCIVNAKLSKPHMYRFEMQVHAQEIEKDKP